MYQVRCSLRVSSKLTAEVEVTAPEVNTGLGSAIVLANYGACRPFQILYRNEEVTLKDVVLLRCHMLVDGTHLKESFEKAEFSLVLELWFSDASPASMVIVSSRVLQLNFSPIEGLHYHLPVLFDYFHLSAISLTIHATLTALHQPSLKRGILRYMQSCAPKTTKSWSRVRSTQCSLLTDTVLPETSNKIYNRINELPQIQLEAYNVLIEASNNLKATIKEYRILLLQREEVITENYESLIVKQDREYFKKISKRNVPVRESSTLAELCAANIKLWNYFLLNFSCKTAIQQKLSKKHHSMRVRRFSEFFFLVYNPRKTAIGNFDTNYQKYLVIAEIGRRSKYMQTLPSLPVQCNVLDGDNSTMPIIFEDQYQDFTEHYNKRTYSLQVRGSSAKKDISFKTTNVLNDTSCSCGIGTLLDRKKNLEKISLTSDFYSFSPNSKTLKIPTRHSKSLDQLQLNTKSALHHSLNNLPLPDGKASENGVKFHKMRKKLNNVSSECNIRSFEQTAKNTIFNSTRNLTYDKNSCLCLSQNNQNTNFSAKPKIDARNCSCDSSILNLQNHDCAKKKEKRKEPSSTNEPVNGRVCKKLVKSLSQSSNVKAQTLPRSNSMQFFSSQKMVVDETQKFNTLANTKNVRNNGAYFPEHGLMNSDTKNNSKQRKTKYSKHKSKSKNEIKNWQISSSSSEESLVSYKKYTGSSLEFPNKLSGMRKSRSTSNLEEQKVSSFLTHSESLPNIFPKLENKLSYSNVKYYTSSSSNSEESGWISSRSSSSSIDIRTKPKECCANSEKTKFYSSSRVNGVGDNKPSASRKRSTKRAKKHSKCSKYNLDIPLYKGCDTYNQSNIYDGIALPPPKQFRDLESPNSSITNGTNYEEELKGVDNLLYHVIDTQTNLATEPHSYNYSKSIQTEDINFYRGTNADNENAFMKAKSEFKSQLNFPGILYSDLNLFASTVPYFHVSDEFRVFSPEGMHLIICVHGLDGNSADLRLVKTYLELGLPGAYLDFLMSERNQGDTFSDFDTMTDRLVSEIMHYLDSSRIRPTRVSFVGHSLGNIIIRSALTRPQMKFLLPRLHTFLSLSGPHLGTLYNSSGLVNMGMWFMQKWKKSGSLLQLCLKDTTDWRRSFLYTLSQRSTIHHFKNILLCGSGQDRYVPLHSARIELCKEAIKDTSEQGAIFREMVHNIISPIISKKDVNLLRYDIHHALPNTANALIGRAAHIAVLDSELFIEKFMAVVGIKYFR